MSLIVTYGPHEDESGLGYYRRLAADNMLSGWRELARYSDVAPSPGALLEQAEHVAAQLGLEPGWALAAREHESVRRSWGSLSRNKADAVCPCCIAESAYLRHHWSHAYVTACPEHRIQLVDHCDACGEPLSPNREHIDRCSCGRDLRELPRQPATQSQRWLSTLIASGGKQSGRIEPELRKVSVSGLAQLAATLCLSSDASRPTARRSAAYPQSVSAAVAFLMPLETLLADWPQGFRSHVEQRIAAGKPEARTLNTLLGPWYIALRKNCQGTALEPFLQVVIDVAADKFDGLLGLDSAKTLAEEATDYVRAPDAARAIGISESKLHKAFEAGECAYRTRRTGTRGRVYEIPRSEVTRIQLARGEWVSEAQACEIAAVPPSVLTHMMTAGVIRSDVNWRHDLLKGGPVHAPSIHALSERVRGAAELGAAHEDETLTLANMTSRRMGDKKAIQTAIQAVADGQVRAVVCTSQLGDMAFRRKDIAAYFGTPLLEAGMSIQQLSKLTGWKWESISNWIDEGLLESEAIRAGGRPCRVVLPHQLLAFRQTYVPLADLARSMGTKSSALAKLLPGIELVGPKRLPDGAMRGGLVRLVDLCRLAIIGARAGQDLFVQ